LKMRVVLLTILGLALATLPAWGDQTIYDNGPANGTTDAWTINFGYIVSDSFNTGVGMTVTDFEFAVWEFPGDTVSRVDWSITTAENGGTVIGSGTASVTDKFISANQYGYNIDVITATGLNVSVSEHATYWLNLQNASVASGDPVYWDENSGTGCGGTGGGANCPSSASESALGTIPSEAFTISGNPTGTVPEPSSILLFGSGILGLVGLLRHKLL